MNFTQMKQRVIIWWKFTLKDPWFLLIFRVSLISLFIGFLVGALDINSFEQAFEEALAESEQQAQNLEDQGFLERWANQYFTFLALIAGTIYFGFMLGLIPVMNVVAINFILGYVLGQALLQLDQIEWFDFLLGVASTVLISLPLLLWAAVWGIKIGLLWIMPESAGKRLEVLNDTVLLGTKVFLIIAAILILPSLIEAIRLN